VLSEQDHTKCIDFSKLKIAEHNLYALEKFYPKRKIEQMCNLPCNSIKSVSLFKNAKGKKFLVIEFYEQHISTETKREQIVETMRRRIRYWLDGGNFMFYCYRPDTIDLPNNIYLSRADDVVLTEKGISYFKKAQARYKRKAENLIYLEETDLNENDRSECTIF